MFFCCFQSDDGPRLGARLDAEMLVDLQAAHGLHAGGPHPALASPLALLEAGARGLDVARGALEHARATRPEPALRPLAGLRFLAPVPRPVRCRNFSVYEGHIKNGIQAAITMRAGKALAALNQRLGLIGVPKAWYRAPAYYKGNHCSVVGPDAEIVWPPYTELLDYELELAFFIGTPGANIRADRAMEHVFGYTILNDVSARDVLMKEIMGRLGPAKGKDFDTGNPLGPWLATRDEVPDPYALSGEVRVNGEVRARCTTSDMYHRIEAMVVEASRGETLYAGELFGTGACTMGSGIEQLRFLAPGDVVELVLPPLGVLRNRVARPAP
jgi:2-keto-4-pentenoate hydratase/2-oxohepta-3-ene-1,7-dioic acid hydratase in catechol pathway